MKRSPSVPALFAALLLLGACTVQTGTVPSETASGSNSISQAPVSASGAAASETEELEIAAEPAATGTDSLEVHGDAAPAAVTGHLIIDTIGFGMTPEKDGPPRLYEYFDYDCEYCRQHAMEERAWIDANYVATGKLGIERVFVSFTPQGKRMDQAALCAASQGFFTEMDAYLMANVPRNDPTIFAFAKTLKMDQKRFATCMENMAVAEGSHEVPGGEPVKRVPAFILNDARWEGILPRAELQKTIDEALR